MGDQPASAVINYVSAGFEFASRDILISLNLIRNASFTDLASLRSVDSLSRLVASPGFLVQRSV